MKYLRLELLSAGFLMTCVSLAEAHAFIDHAEPAVGSTVSECPSAVKIWFTRKLDASSTIQVFDGKGNEIDRRDARLDPKDATLLSVSLPRLAAGTCKVTWQAVCRDGHTTHGSFGFEIR